MLSSWTAAQHHLLSCLRGGNVVGGRTGNLESLQSPAAAAGSRRDRPLGARCGFPSVQGPDEHERCTLIEAGEGGPGNEAFLYPTLLHSHLHAHGFFGVPNHPPHLSSPISFGHCHHQNPVQLGMATCQGVLSLEGVHSHSSLHLCLQNSRAAAARGSVQEAGQRLPTACRLGCYFPSLLLLIEAERAEI